MGAVVNLKIAAEHMEEDEETPKSIPKWVELEYMVGIPYPRQPYI